MEIRLALPTWEGVRVSKWLLALTTAMRDLILLYHFGDNIHGQLGHDGFYSPYGAGRHEQEFLIKNNSEKASFMLQACSTESPAAVGISISVLGRKSRVRRATALPCG